MKKFFLRLSVLIIAFSAVLVPALLFDPLWLCISWLPGFIVFMYLDDAIDDK